MDKQTNRRTRTWITGGAMVGAAFLAFSLNQGGLTGRATGGAAGCGGAETESTVEKNVLANPITDVINKPVLKPRVTLTPRGDSITVQFIPGTLPTLASTNVTQAPETFTYQPQEAVRTIDIQRPATLWQRLEKDGHDTFLQLVQMAGLDAVFQDQNSEFTLLVPSEEALEAWPERSMMEEPQNAALLAAVLTHHMVKGRHAWHSMPSDIMETAMLDQPLRVMVGDGIFFSTVDSEAALTDQRNREVERSMVHEVDAVLMPKFTLQVHLLRNGFNLMYALLQASEFLHEVTDPEVLMTILAIPDDVLSDNGMDLAAIQDPTNYDEVRAIARNHVFVDALSSFQGGSNSSMSGLNFEFQGADELRAGNDQVMHIGSTWAAGNGYIHEVDDVVTQTSF